MQKKKKNLVIWFFALAHDVKRGNVELRNVPSNLTRMISKPSNFQGMQWPGSEAREKVTQTTKNKPDSNPSNDLGGTRLTEVGFNPSVNKMVIRRSMSCTDLIHGQLPFEVFLTLDQMIPLLAKNNNLHPGQ
jgi:hypothetical protein